MTERTIRSLAKELAAEWYENHVVARQKGQMVEVRCPMTGRLLRVRDPNLFLGTYPTLKDYWKGLRYGCIKQKIEGSGVQVTWHVDDGSVTKGPPGWAYHYTRARKRLVHMLGLPDVVVHPQTKHAIAKAIIEDREKQLRYEALGTASELWDPGIPQAVVEP